MTNLLGAEKQIPHFVRDDKLWAGGWPSYREAKGGALRLGRGAGLWDRFLAFRVWLPGAPGSRPFSARQPGHRVDSG
jgi:hypothetical protein